MNKKSGWKGARCQDEGGIQQARRVFNTKLLEGYYCNQDYNLELYQTNEITTEGLLLIGKMKPKVSSLPEFWIRWDEKKDELDVDMHGELEHREDWINSRNGYEGHHTVKMKKEGRHFKVSIETPTMKVFDGAISFNLARDRTLRTAIGFNASSEVTVNKKNKT